MQMKRVGTVEAFDVSAVLWALHGSAYTAEFKRSTMVGWFEVEVQTWEDDRDTSEAEDLVKRAIGVSMSTPMTEIRRMSECCGLGRDLDSVEVCPNCGAHAKLRESGDPIWRHPQASDVKLRETIDWLRQTYHRAHHEGPLDECEKNTCDAALKALGKR